MIFMMLLHLTKIVATLPLLMELEEKGIVSLESKLRYFTRI